MKHDEETGISEDGKPISRLASVQRSAALDARMADLVRAGLATAPSARLPREFFSRELPPDPDGSVVKAVLEERDEGR